MSDQTSTIRLANGPEPDIRKLLGFLVASFVVVTVLANLVFAVAGPDCTRMLDLTAEKLGITASHLRTEIHYDRVSNYYAPPSGGLDARADVTYFLEPIFIPWTVISLMVALALSWILRRKGKWFALAPVAITIICAAVVFANRPAIDQIHVWIP